MANASPSAPQPAEDGAAHELRVNHLELEMQNEELRHTQIELSAMSARYFDLFDLAPVGYCTLSKAGLIVEANLTAAALLGVKRSALIQEPLSRFILRSDQDTYLRLFVSRAGKNAPPHSPPPGSPPAPRDPDDPAGLERSFDLRMVKGDGTEFWAQLTFSEGHGADGEPLRRLILSDISTLKRQEEALELSAQLMVMIHTAADYRHAMEALTGILRQWSDCEATGIRLRDGDDYPYYETSGFPADFVQRESQLCARGCNGALLRDSKDRAVLECMCGNVLCGRFDPSKPFFTATGSFWTNSTTALLAGTTDADRGAHTRNWCNIAGYESVALIPLRTGQSVFGLLQFNDRRPDHFTPDLIANLERMADRIAHTLASRQSEQGRATALERLRKTEGELRMKSALLEAQLNAALDGILVVDAAGKKVLQNQRCIELWKIPKPVADEQDHGPQLEFCTNRTKNPQAFAERISHLNAHPSETSRDEIELVDGTILDRYSSPVTGSDERHLGRLWVFRDISEHRRGEAAHERLAKAVEQCAETILITDARGAISYVNPAFEKTTGYSAADAVGRNPRILKSDKQDAEFYKRMWATLAAGQVWSGRMINKRKDGSLYEEDGTISPIRDAAGAIISYVAVTRDVSRESQLEHQLLQAQKMESVGRLAGGVAHDFNNLIGGIMGYAEACLDELPPDHPVRHDLNEITRESQRLADLTGQLLAFARKQTISPRVLSLNDTIAGMLKLMRRLIGEDIRMVWMPGANLWPVRLDPSQVDQILANLCVNARDAISTVGTLTVETSNATLEEADCADHAGFAPGEYVLLTVSDDGCGMTKDVLDQIFEPFFTTKGANEGTGLGLATVYGIVKQNSGFIYVTSEPGRGATFRIYLPRFQGKVAETVQDSSPIPCGRGETILLVEDEPSLRLTCSLFLRKQGYNVLTADSPAEALELAGENPDGIQLLLTDVIMPEMNGRHLADQLLATAPGLKILFMSAYTADVVIGRGNVKGAMHFIQKPFRRDDLAVRVRGILDA